jgi:hypothetical protein
MPYRRLPNTDAARIRAMKAALGKGENLPPAQVAYSSKTIIRLQKFLPLFEHSLQSQRQTITSQNKRAREYNEVIKKAKLYLTHFVRVMNMAIFRGDLPVETRAYFGLALNDPNVPALNTENELVNWGKRIIEGEEYRIRQGGSPITNPTIAVVKVRYKNFIEARDEYHGLSRKCQELTEKINELRKEADEIILHLWNEIETTYKALPDDLKKSECEDYGLVYFYRKNEISGAVDSVEA